MDRAEDILGRLGVCRGCDAPKEAGRCAARHCLVREALRVAQRNAASWVQKQAQLSPTLMELHSKVRERLQEVGAWPD